MERHISRISKKCFVFEWENTEISIQIPDLKGNKITTWGDWGPMYRITLEQDRPILIGYNKDFQASSQSHLKIESPILVVDREKYPFYLLIEDQKHCLNYKLFLDEDFELAKVKVIKKDDNLLLFEMPNSENRFVEVV